jgi:small subunit ribosomal protein S6
MNKYELTLVLGEKTTEARKKQVKTSLESLCKTFNVKIEKSDDWGEINLSYPIEKNNNGTFLHFVLESGGKDIKNLIEKLRFEEYIIRYLLVNL